MTARWQGTYREEGQVRLEPQVGKKMNTKGVVCTYNFEEYDNPIFQIDSSTGSE